MKLEWDSPAWRVERDEKLREWLLFPEAVDCLLKISHAAEVWDDLIDGDTETPAERIHSAFVGLLVKLETNPFYTQNRERLLPVIWTAINAWLDANELVRTDDRQDRALAFYLRNLSYEVTCVVALCAGGWDHLRSISLEMRRYFTHESYFNWEHRHDIDCF